MGERRVKADKLVKAENDGRDFPLGVTKTADGIHISTVAQGDSCRLVVYEKGNKEEIKKIPFSEDGRMGDVWNMDLCGDNFKGLEYCLEVDGKQIPDCFGHTFTGREKWGNLQAITIPMKSPLVLDDFDWEGDRNPQIPYEQSIIYRIHTRGFTKHASSRVQDKGTFKAIGEKIDYLKTLGITAVELMPPNEFPEVIVPEAAEGNPYKDEPTGKINYWGYTPGHYFAPKASYASGREKHPAEEFKTLVRELHKNHIEIIIELYFTEKESPSMVQDAIRFWVREYHVDGIHLSGAVHTALLTDDPYLSATKLLASGWSGETSSKHRHLGEYNDGFMVDMRRFLKGDENQMNNLIFRTKRNPEGFGVINYMADTNGFTMTDMVSYERKHNEANGEDNRDGSECNYTWNCGIEGPTRKKKVVEMRKKQIRNAYLLLLLSQGTPMILSGDEFGTTKNGNNNSYCQDNEISWLNWNLFHSHQELFEFVQYAIAFRQRHPVFHKAEEPRVIDYLACGHPDVSYHGVKAWCPEFENFRRQLGIMYCGEYDKKADGTPDDYFFVAYNMHWEPHEFALPKLPKELVWYVAFDTDDDINNGIYKEGEELFLEEQKQFMVPPRSIVVFVGRKKR
ncbi:MAG: alpha-amylase [Clostridium sp.]